MNLIIKNLKNPKFKPKNPKSKPKNPKFSHNKNKNCIFYFILTKFNCLIIFFKGPPDLFTN